ncbi:hypothetical protein LJC20_01245 [Eubacteriales bacterium OttesenSCG-928-M02]|nr:hypothetical protein [Eubacteriales bacterium OttesenSCG-928-M02]
MKSIPYIPWCSAAKEQAHSPVGQRTRKNHFAYPFPVMKADALSPDHPTRIMGV